MSLEIHSATAERWPDLVELFERRGVRGGHQNTPAYGCWCMYWRDRGVGHGERSKRAMGKLVGAGREPGLLAYDDGSPVGWVAVAPRGIASELLDAAVAYAFSHGATSVEAYAHLSNSADYMGHAELYRRAGFAHVRDANKRAVVRIEREPGSKPRRQQQ